jgi:PAS domain S-box-containing protein
MTAAVPTPLRVLFVEDRSADVEALVRELERGGYDVTHGTVQTADQLGVALTQSEWDVVISNYSVPGFASSAALDFLQTRGVDLPFIIVSDTVGEEAAVTALKAGAHDFLVKGRLARLVASVERGLRDVVNRREHARAEATLRASEARYRSLVDHAAFGMYQATTDGRLLTVNRALVAMLGYDSEDQLLGTGIAHRHAEPAAGEVLLARVLEAGGISGEEAIWNRQGGEHIRVRLHAKVVDDEVNGSVLEVIVEDITQQHRLQEQLRQSQKMEAIGRLAGGVAHDFNNMLTAILGYAELLTEQIGPDKPIGRDLLEIKKAAERAAALTRQLLAFSKKQVLTMEPLDLTEIVRTIEPMLRRLLGERIAIRTELSSQLASVLADEAQLEHMLINLSVNARDAMPAGGTLTLATRSVALDAEYVRSHPGARVGAYVMVSVSDTGVGMTPDVQARIFEPFFTTKQQGRGTGLGLAVVYGTVKQIGGYIECESWPGFGTSFRIYLPISAEQARPRPRPAQADAPVGHETVLLVEDEGAVRAFAKIALQRFGYRVKDAESAECALAWLDEASNRIDLLLTDVVLPGMDGRELASCVKERRPDTRVLFMSGYSNRLGSEEGFLDPGLHLLEKPFTADALLKKTRELLGEDAALPLPAQLRP